MAAPREDTIVLTVTELLENEAGWLQARLVEFLKDHPNGVIIISGNLDMLPSSSLSTLINAMSKHGALVQDGSSVSTTDATFFFVWKVAPAIMAEESAAGLTIAAKGSLNALMKSRDESESKREVVCSSLTVLAALMALPFPSFRREARGPWLKPNSSLTILLSFFFGVCRDGWDGGFFPETNRRRGTHGVGMRSCRAERFLVICGGLCLFDSFVSSVTFCNSSAPMSGRNKRVHNDLCISFSMSMYLLRGRELNRKKMDDIFLPPLHARLSLSSSFTF